MKRGFFFQAEDGIRYGQESRGLGDVYKRQVADHGNADHGDPDCGIPQSGCADCRDANAGDASGCLLYTSDAADELLCVDLGGRRLIKKKKTQHETGNSSISS